MRSVHVLDGVSWTRVYAASIFNTQEYDEYFGGEITADSVLRYSLGHSFSFCQWCIIPNPTRLSCVQACIVGCTSSPFMCRPIKKGHRIQGRGSPSDVMSSLKPSHFSPTKTIPCPSPYVKSCQEKSLGVYQAKSVCVPSQDTPPHR